MPESILNGALTRAITRVLEARNAVGTLKLYYRGPDPDIDDRVRGAYEQLARAEVLLEALSDDLAVWEAEAHGEK